MSGATATSGAPGAKDMIVVAASTVIAVFVIPESRVRAPGTVDWTGAWLSPDGGESWRQVRTGLGAESRVFGLAVHPKQPRTILAGADDGIYRTEDGGEHFEIAAAPHFFLQLFDGVQAVAMALQSRPDLCILDVGMPGLTGLQAAREIRAQLTDTRVLILSMHDDERYLFEALKAGAAGYVLKREADQDLVDAVHAVGRGEAFLTNAAERSIIRQWMADGAAGPAIPLTPREEEVVKLIAEAHTNAQIAEILHLAEKTIESHRANVLRKLGMRDRVELVRYAIRRGLIEP